MNPVLPACAAEGGSRREGRRTPDDGFRLVGDRPTSTPVPARKAWLMTCRARLAQLQPMTDARALDRLAAELWHEAGSFDPAVAAEMEVEAGPVGEGDG